MSDREIANQLASSIIWLEKVQLVCPSYYYVNAGRARYNYLLRQGTWSMMFGPGKTSTAILNEASAKRNQEFNNSTSKKCRDTEKRSSCAVRGPARPSQRETGPGWRATLA